MMGGRIEAGMPFGGKVYRRRSVVAADWEEVTPAGIEAMRRARKRAEEVTRMSEPDPAEALAAQDAAEDTQDPQDQAEADDGPGDE